MKVSLRLTQYDLLAQTESLIVETHGILNEDRLTYMEEDKKYRHEIMFKEDKIILERKGEYGSVTELPFVGKGVSVMNSPYGEMTLESRLIKWHKESTCYQAEYQLSSSGKVLTHMRMVWDITMPA